MATQTINRRKVSSKKLSAKRRKISRKINRFIDRFRFWSTLGFWAIVAYFVLTHGWI
jgi:hypothetical protein